MRHVSYKPVTLSSLLSLNAHASDANTQAKHAGESAVGSVQFLRILARMTRFSLQRVKSHQAQRAQTLSSAPMAVKVHAREAPTSRLASLTRLRGLKLFIAAFQNDRKPLHLFALPALSAVLSVVRNATLCSVVAWAANWCYAQGNVFSPVREQSYVAFVAAQVVMFHVFSSAAVVVMVAHVLQAQYRRSVDAIAAANRLVPSIWSCIAKLVKRTVVLFSVLLVLIRLATYALSLAPVSVRPLNLEFYASCVLNHVFVSQTDLVAHTILRQETVLRRPTVEVRPAADAQQYQVRPPPSATSPSPRRSAQHIQDANRSRHRNACSKSCRYFCWTFSLLGFVFVASIGVQLTRHVAITESQAAFVSFTGASTLLKLGMQEVAKWSALRRNVRDIRLMCVALGVPTVLIDTQLRLAVQRLGSQQSTLAGTLLLALLEVTTRLIKGWLIKWQIFRRERRSARSRGMSSRSLVAVVPEASVGPATNATVAAPASAATHHRPPRLESSSDVETARWTRKVWQLYVAEVHADMAAEYIAIGCSTSILFFYGSHAKYALGSTARSGKGPSQPLRIHDHVVALVVQVAVELVVDIVATLLELRRGLDFRQLLTHTAFIVTFFVHLAIINIHISSAVYLLVD